MQEATSNLYQMLTLHKLDYRKPITLGRDHLKLQNVKHPDQHQLLVVKDYLDVIVQQNAIQKGANVKRQNIFATHTAIREIKNVVTMTINTIII